MFLFRFYFGWKSHYSADPNLRFRSFRFRICPRWTIVHRGDPFSHPSGSSALRPIRSTSNSNRKERAEMAPGPGSLRLGFLGQLSFILQPPWLASCRWTGRAPNPEITPGSRKRSVPGRVHSAPERCGSQAPFWPRSNPLLTHGAVESPVNFFFADFLKSRELPLPISPKGSTSNPVPG
jgi:hypothetical protein